MHARPQTDRCCDWPDCPEAGLHRAPKAAEALEEFFWFCLAHVRQYNAQWNFFKGRSAEEVEQYRWASVTGHRPTWPMSHRPDGAEWQVEDGLDIFGARPGVSPFVSAADRTRRARLTPAERRALDTLGLDESATVAEIKRRYKLLVKKYHPDSRGDPGTEDRLKRIIQAYSDLRKSGRLAAAGA